MTHHFLRAASAALALMLLIAPRWANAEDAGLYDAPPPPDAAFVRILNADVAQDASVTIAGVTLNAPAAGMSGYAIITKGDYSAAVPGGTLPVSFAAQKFYTVLLTPTGTGQVFEDAPIANPVHAGLYFYNVSGSPLQLDAKVNGKQAAVFKDVAPGAATSREVNAFDVSFVVAAAGGATVELPEIAMVRQKGVSVVALQDGDKVIAFQVQNALATGS